MPPLTGREVFLVLKYGFFTGYGIAVGTIDPVRHLPYEVLQSLQVVGVSTRAVSCVPVPGVSEKRLRHASA